MANIKDSRPGQEFVFTPYADGEHCIFYSAQAANLHFNGTGLPREQRDTLKQYQPRVDSLLKKLSPEKDTGRPASYLTRSIVTALKALDREGIAASGIYCAPEDAPELGRSGFVKRRHVPVIAVDGTQKHTIPTPAIITTERRSHGDSHMWFCQDEQAWHRGKQEMDREGESLTALVPLRRK